MSDMVNHPEHYRHYSVEVIDIIDQMNFCVGSAVKYILRFPWKAREVEWRIAVLMILKEGKNDMA